MTPRYTKDKIKGTFMYPSSDAARRAFGITKRPPNSFDKERMYNRFIYVTKKGLHSALVKLNKQIINRMKTTKERTVTWERIIGNLDHPAIDDKLAPLIETWATDNNVQTKHEHETRLTWTEAEDEVIRNRRKESPLLSHAAIAGLLTNKSEKQVSSRWENIQINDKKKSEGIVSNRAKSGPTQKAKKSATGWKGTRL